MLLEPLEGGEAGPAHLAAEVRRVGEAVFRHGPALGALHGDVDQEVARLDLWRYGTGERKKTLSG